MKIWNELRKMNRRLSDAAAVALALALAIGASGAILNLGVLKLRTGFDLEPQMEHSDSPQAGKKSGRRTGQLESYYDRSKLDNGLVQSAPEPQNGVSVVLASAKGFTGNSIIKFNLANEISYRSE
jgi:hypothetical protein